LSAPLDTLAHLRSAIEALEAERPEAVIAALEPLPDGGGPLGRALLLVAQGLDAEAAGHADEAARLMEQALGSSPALPASALRTLVASFGRSGRHRLRDHAFLLLQAAEPETVDVPLKRLPQAELADHAIWAQRASIDSRRYLTYAFAPFKRALRDRIGREAAALQLAAVRGPTGPRVAVRRRLEPLIDHARQSGRDYEELIAAGPAPPTPLRLLGAASTEPEMRRTRTLFACVLEDVIVTARSSILLHGERALMDIQEDELTSVPHDLADDPLVASDRGEDVILLEPADRDALRRVPEAVWLTGVHTVAFGHWIIEYLPKVWALMERDGFGAVPILVDARLPPQHLEAVRLFAGDANPLIVLDGYESVRVDRLWVASTVGYLGGESRRVRLGMDDDAWSSLLERIAPTLESIDTAGAPPRLHLTRKPKQHRRLLNAADVGGRLEAAGFVGRDFAEETFTDQLRLVRGADWIVGPSGSALLMAIFARPGLRLGALVPRGLSDVAWIGQACRRLGIELTAIVGDAVPHEQYAFLSDYRIDLDVLDAYLAEPVADR
jgi:capsular polysaccharide biosynthesis protein